MRWLPPPSPAILNFEINERSTGKPPANLTSYEHLLQGCWHYQKFLPEQHRGQAMLRTGRRPRPPQWRGPGLARPHLLHRFNLRLLRLENAAKAVELSAEAVALDP